MKKMFSIAVAAISLVGAGEVFAQKDSLIIYCPVYGKAGGFIQKESYEGSLDPNGNNSTTLKGSLNHNGFVFSYLNGSMSRFTGNGSYSFIKYTPYAYTS
jgi:hypothetical protein